MRRWSRPNPKIYGSFFPAAVLHGMALLDRSFALFDDAVRRLKVVRMSECHSESGIVILLSPYAEAIPTENARVLMSSQPEPMLRRVPLAGGEHLYLWRSPWCMYHAPSKCWIAILDSDKRSSIPGDFIYSTGYTFNNTWHAEYTSLRKTMMAAMPLEQMRMLAPSAPPAIPSRKPPAHVAAIM